MKRLVLGLALWALAICGAHAQLPPINGVAGPTTSAQLKSIISDATGSGPLNFGPSAATITVGTTTITSGTTNGLLYNNTGILGNLSTIANGVLVTNGGGIPSISATLPAVNASAATSLTTGSSTARSLASRFDNPVDVRDYGALCDGATDDSAAFSSALATSNRSVIVPGNKTCVVKNLTINTNANLYCAGSSLAVAAAGNYIVKLTGYAPQLHNCQVQDATGRTLRSDTTSGIVAPGATTVNLTTPVATSGLTAKNAVVITLASGARFTTRIETAAASAITILDAIPDSVTAIAVTAGGTGWVTGQHFTVLGGLGAPATGRVTGISGGAVTTAVLEAPGLYTTAPGAATTTQASAGSSGAGLTVTLTTSGVAAGASVQSAYGLILVQDAQYAVIEDIRVSGAPVGIQISPAASAPSFNNDSHAFSAIQGNTISLIGIFKDTDTSNLYFSDVSLYGTFSAPAFGATGIYSNSRNPTIASGGDSYVGLRLLQWETAFWGRVPSYTRFVAPIIDNTRNYGAIIDNGSEVSFAGGAWSQFSGSQVLSGTGNGGVGLAFINNSQFNSMEGYSSFHNASDLHVETGSTVQINMQAWGPTRTFTGDTSGVNGLLSDCLGGAPGGCSFTVTPPALNSSDNINVQGFAVGAGAEIRVRSTSTSAPLYVGSQGAECVYSQAPAGSTRWTLCPALATLGIALNYGGVTLSNAVTGTGSMVLSASPTFTGTVAAPTINATTAIQASGAPGLSTTKTVRDAAGTGTCTLIFTFGLLTGGSC